MTTPSEKGAVHAPEYYLKYMSWHTKDMAECMKELVASINVLTTRLEQSITRMAVQRPELRPEQRLHQVRPPESGKDPSSEEIPF